MPRHIMQDIIENAGYETRSYSGRYMYGDTCIATNPGSSLFAFVADLIQAARDESCEESERDHALDELQDALRGMSTDQMGKGTIVYFKTVPYTSEDEEEGVTPDNVPPQADDGV